MPEFDRKVQDDKYIVFRRSVLVDTIDPEYFSQMEAIAVPDAVVIRRQDKFASPCLLTYAAMMQMVGDQIDNREMREELLAIADYFHRQGVLAGEEGWKLPTL